MKDHLPSSLDEQLANLPRDITPSRNLWPGIVRGIGRGTARGPHRSRPLAFAAAAAVAAACVASALTWAVLHGLPNQAPAPVMAARASGYSDLHDAAYVTARDSLEHTFHERLALLDPGTRAQIESSLAVIRKAHEDIRKALAAAPASPVLEQLLESTWHDELDLYDRVVQSTQPNMTRT